MAYKPNHNFTMRNKLVIDYVMHALHGGAQWHTPYMLIEKGRLFADEMLKSNNTETEQAQVEREGNR